MSATTFRKRLYVIIFEAETPAGKAFDVALIWAIVLSLGVIMLESVDKYNTQYGHLFKVAEWIFTLLFTVEYGVRIYCSPNPLRYVTSFMGVVDLISIVPTYVGLVLSGAHYMMVIRTIRLLRVFRVLKLTTYLGEANLLMTAIRASSQKITVFVGAVLVIVTLMGTLMYLIEGKEHGFTSIPRGIYWAIVTLTTVGYGDITPRTELGQALSALIMILGYGILAVPTGIVTSELTQLAQQKAFEIGCPNCGHQGHDSDARFCKRCGCPLPER